MNMGWSVSPYVFLCLFQMLLLLHFPSYTASSTVPLCNPHDSSALFQFMHSFVVVNSSVSAYWCPSLPSKTESWENGSDCCLWDGVTCDPMSGHVIGLDLTCSHLQGQLHPNSTLFHLTHLQHLNLAFNDFSFSLLSPAISDLVSLTHLNLSRSSFVGDIPSKISHLSKLVSLDLSHTNLRLDASTWDKFILNATNLEELVLDLVDLSSIKEGSLSLLMNLSSLVSLLLSESGLHGNFPSDVLCLPNIQELSLFENNELTGQLPKSNWSVALRLLDLTSTAFSGEIPDSIGHSQSLQLLRLMGCQFKGLIPPSFWNLTQLTQLDLSLNHLIGKIPSSLSNINHLMYLDLKYNHFKCHIPNVFYNFTQLQNFDLSNNHLGGQLPSSLFNLTQLTFLSLSNNELEGPIPNKISELSILEEIYLSQNLLNGTIPHWCYSLSSLTLLYLSDNNFTGSIGEFSAFSLIHLSLSINRFEGKFSNSVFQLENLMDLDLSSTNLRGHLNFYQFSKLKYLNFLDLSDNFLSVDINDTIDYILPELEILHLSSCNITKFPKFISRLPNLERLDLSNNNIHGKIPRWFNDNLLLSWKRIELIDLSFNKLQGDIPILSYGIAFFWISNNNLTGDISSALCNANSLLLLSLSHNNLTGKIPQCLGTFRELMVLDLQMNNLYGGIPDTFSKANSFETINLNGNLLEGPLPRSFANCTYLEVLDLGGNHIHDIFPSWLETLPDLQVLILRANKFYGILTSFNTELSFPKLRIFDVSNNNFSGPLPTSYLKNFQAMMDVNDSQSGLEYMSTSSFPQWGKPYHDSIVIIMKGLSMNLERILTTFITIDLSNNQFEGEIPEVIGELNSLKGLNLSYNAITGNIPQSLGNIRSLEWLDLSWNQLRGEIPLALTDLNFLSVLNLSQNHLEGLIPTGKQFNTFQNDSYGGNPMLCGTPLSKSCNHDEEHPPSTFHHEEKFGFGWKPVAVGYACGVVFGMLLGYCFFLSGKPQWLARLVGMPKRSVKRTNNRVNANRRRMN